MQPACVSLQVHQSAKCDANGRSDMSVESRSRRRRPTRRRAARAARNANGDHQQQQQHVGDHRQRSGLGAARATSGTYDSGSRAAASEMRYRHAALAASQRLFDLAAAGSSSVARRAVRQAAVDMSTATTTAACTRARAARAHHTLKLGPRIYGPRRCLYLCPGGLCFPDPTSAGGSFPPSRAGGFLRRERPVVEERRSRPSNVSAPALCIFLAR